MAATTYNDLTIVHQYLDEITTFIQGIVQDESRAIVLACQVFEEHKKRAEYQQFENEETRIVWLFLKARNLASSSLKIGDEMQ